MTETTDTTITKTYRTREEFERLRTENALRMCDDKTLQKDALSVLARADRYYWVHQTNWMGEPILNVAQDVLALQEVIFRTKPDYVVEVGAAWGGSLLFYSTLMEAWGGKGVVAIDIYIPNDLKERIGRHGSISDRIHWIEGSSTDPNTVQQLQTLIGPDAKVLVVLDSDHTHEHVLQELDLYSPLIQPGQYLICSDGIIEHIPSNPDRPRGWGRGNNPFTAVTEFLERNSDFEVDKNLEAKLLFTCNPKGYLRRKSAERK